MQSPQKCRDVINHVPLLQGMFRIIVNFYRDLNLNSTNMRQILVHFLVNVYKFVAVKFVSLDICSFASQIDSCFK